jgi:3-hydroxyanthranilate 3,4-dioxygenase
MTLKVVEKGARKDIQIKEGELFLLPAYVEHSPRRFENTLGCVVERERTPNERDCIR